MKTATAVKAPVKSAAMPDLPAQVFADASATKGQPGVPDPAAAKRQEHLQKIRQLTFDRRPSAILKAWSTPREEALKEAENPAAQANPGMAVAGPNRVVRRMAPGVVVAGPNVAPMVPPGIQAGPAANAQPDPFDRELRGFQYDVTLGDWPAVTAFLARLPEEEGKAAYEQLVQGLGNPPGMQGNFQWRPGSISMRRMARALGD